MIREVAEELNLDITGMQYRYVGSLNPAQGAICFIQLYELSVENGFSIDFNKQDFSEFYWLSPQEIVDRINRGDQAKDTLAKIMKVSKAL